jgi:hypothetical protein
MKRLRNRRYNCPEELGYVQYIQMKFESNYMWVYVVYKVWSSSRGGYRLENMLTSMSSPLSSS